MPCIPIAGGFLCTRGRGQRHACSRCGKPATIRCDWPLKGAKAGATCDAWLCRACATNVGPDRDYCPPHYAMHRASPALADELRAAGNQAAPAEAPPGPSGPQDAPPAGVGASSPSAAAGPAPKADQLRLL